MRHALVTGNAGFVGRHMHCHLEQAGYMVHGVDIVNGIDARDFFRRNDSHYDLVVHLAAVVGGRQKIEGSPLSLAVDLSIDAELFGWALRTRPDRVVYFSSSAVYPTWMQRRHLRCQLREDMLDLNNISNPDLTYGWAKLTGEMLAQHAEDEGLRVHVFRPFSGYGEDQSLDYPFPSFIDRAIRKADPFDVWGDGEQVRDFIHIKDICSAVLKAVEQDVRGPVNLGTGRATSFNELADMVTSAAGYPPSVRHLPAEPVGVHYRVADPTKMLSFYTPKISLEEGIARALA